MNIADNEAKNWSKPLNVRDKYRIIRTKNIVNELEGSSIADIGCGDGDFLKKVIELKKFKRIIGTDLSKIRLANTLKIQGLKNKIEAKKADILKLPFKKQEIDIVCCLEVLEHIKNLKIAAKELKRVTNKYLVVSVPLAEDIHHEICIHCGKRTPRFGHIYNFEEKKLIELFEDKNFKHHKSISLCPKFVKLLSKTKTPMWLIKFFDLFLRPKHNKSIWIVSVFKRVG